jgi:hypothetical protein
LIVGVAVLVISTVLVSVGRKRLKQAKVPEETIETVKKRKTASGETDYMPQS